MAKGRVGGRGQGGWIVRFRIPLLLIGFLVIAVGVILRRSVGIAAGRELQQLDTRRGTLVALRLRLESEIRAASSRSRLQPIAEQRLNMHVPSDSQVVIITRAPASAGPHDAP